MSHNITGAEPDQFALERAMKNVYECIEASQCELKAIRKPRRKRARLDYIAQTRVTEFKQKIMRLKPRWESLFTQIFRDLSDRTFLSRIAKDIITTLRSTRERYNIEDENYTLVLGNVIRAVIAGIMDDQEVSRASKERQERRKYFIHELLNAPISDEINSINSSERQDEDVDVEIIDILATQSQTQQSQRNATQENSSVKQCCSWEEVAIAKYLIDALSIHSKKVTRNDVELRALIYHIINITYIVDILKNYFKELRTKIDVDLPRSRIKEATEKFEESITKSLELFDIDNPLTVFRNNLRIILMQVRMLRSTLSN